MADEHLRDLERTARRTGDPAALRRVLHRRARSGGLPPGGEALAGVLAREDPATLDGLQDLFSAVAGCDPEAGARAALALARLGRDHWEGDEGEPGLVVETGAPGARIPCPEGTAFAIGRSDLADVVLASPTLARRHLEVEGLPDGRLRLTLLDAARSLTVNGHAAESAVVGPGDRVDTGGLRLRVAGDGLRRLLERALAAPGADGASLARDALAERLEDDELPELARQAYLAALGALAGADDRGRRQLATLAPAAPAALARAVRNELAAWLGGRLDPLARPAGPAGARVRLLVGVRLGPVDLGWDGDGGRLAALTPVGERARRAPACDAWPPGLVRVRGVVPLANGLALGRGHRLELDSARGPEAWLAEGPRSDGARVALVVDLAETVAWLHARGEYLEALAPDLVRIRRGDDRPRILGHGTPLARGEGAARPREAHLYLPPEAFGGASTAPPAAWDVYGLGALAFLLLTGEAPFRREPWTGDALRKAKRSPPPALRRLRPDLDPALDRVVRGALDAVAGDRPSAAALAEALRPFAA